MVVKQVEWVILLMCASGFIGKFGLVCNVKVLPVHTRDTETLFEMLTLYARCSIARPNICRLVFMHFYAFICVCLRFTNEFLY